MSAAHLHRRKREAGSITKRKKFRIREKPGSSPGFRVYGLLRRLHYSAHAYKIEMIPACTFVLIFILVFSFWILTLTLNGVAISSASRLANMPFTCTRGNEKRNPSRG